VSAVVIASGIRGRLRCIRFVVLGFDYVIDLATGFLVIQVMNFFLAGTCIAKYLSPFMFPVYLLMFLFRFNGGLQVIWKTRDSISLIWLKC
jgi:hypothetical protein